jgi:hypothetical protein
LSHDSTPPDAALARATPPQPEVASAEVSTSPDVVLVHSRTDDGAGLKVLRLREQRVEAGEVRPLREGAPIHGEVVTLTPRAEQPLVCDVKVELPAPPMPAVRARRVGPAQVATDRYRDNWELTFARRRDERVN